MTTKTNKCETKVEARNLKERLKNERVGGEISIYRFATPRKYQFFVGNQWEWLAQIS